MRRWALLAGIVVLASVLIAPFTVLGDDPSLDPNSALRPIPEIWARADGPGARAGEDHNWVWGPSLRSMSIEPYRQAPGGARHVFYFDKARMEITNPNGNAQDPWYAAAGLLARDLIAGQIQVGDNDFIEAEPAQVPLTGDIEGNTLSPTYAVLAPLASIGDNVEANRSPNRQGELVTALLRADGSVAPNAVDESATRITGFDGRLSHNIPDVFQEWMSQQALGWEYILGYPLTEPYWVDTVVEGTRKRVLLQAFERRVLTYTPGNPQGWQVEAGNVALQYRAWVGLTGPGDQNLTSLASGVPFGELIVEKARQHGLDPYFFAALAQISSRFDPLSRTADNRMGFFGVRPDLLAGKSYPFEPKTNAEIAAATLADLRGHNDDWRAVLASYYSGPHGPNWSDPALNAFVSGVLDTQAKMISDFAFKPAPLAKAEPALHLIGTGAAAFYSPGYSTAWWHNTIARHAGWGNAVPGWERDPHGYYCVHPDYRPGQRLQLSANGVTLWCTIGDNVNPKDVPLWRSRWVVELSWDTFKALKLDQRNRVEVRAP